VDDHHGFRDAYALETVRPDDIVLVGDSFVWGEGVAKHQRFGDRLEQLYEKEGRRVRVFSLGVRGAGPPLYIESLARVPVGVRAGVVIVAFYPNDIDPRPRARWLRWIFDTSWALGRSSLTCRAVHDLLPKVETPSVAAYHRSLVEDYRAADPTFPRRWADLAGSLDRFKHLADRRAPSRPLLLVIPLMVDYRSYPLTPVHDALAVAAEGLGYDVLDLLPDFRQSLVDGDRYRLKRNDNHFNASVHEFVSVLIKRCLDARPDTAGLGRVR
jgi:hypothetical protein